MVEPQKRLGTSTVDSRYISRGTGIVLLKFKKKIEKIYK